MFKSLVVALLITSPAGAEMAGERVWDFNPETNALIYGTPYSDDVVASFKCSASPGYIEADIPIAGDGGVQDGDSWSVVLDIETNEGRRSHTLSGKRVLVDTRDFNDSYYHTGVFDLEIDGGFLTDLAAGKRLINQKVDEKYWIPLDRIAHELMHLQFHCQRESR